MSLFKKRGRRNIRKKVVEHEEGFEEEEDGGTVVTQTVTDGGGEGTNVKTLPPTQHSDVATGTKKKESRSLLSFEDELKDECPEFKLKKTSLSRRAAKMVERDKRGKRTKRKGDQMNSMSGVVDEGMLDDDEDGENEEEEEEEEGPGHLISLSQQLRDGGFIPNAEFIHRARREREERRQMGDGGGTSVAPSMMSLSTNKKVPTAKGKSRLIREDDNDRSDDSEGEDGGRRRMDAGQHDTAAVKQYQVLQGLEEMGSDEDEETKRWEEEQILKGVKASAPSDQGLPQLNSVPSAIDQSFLMGTVTVGYIDEEYMTPSYTPAVQAYAGLTVPTTVIESLTTATSSSNTGSNSFRIPEKLVPITIESLKSRLSNQLRDLQDSASGHRNRLEQIRTDLEQSQDEVNRTEEQRGDLGRHYVFYQEMRGYLRDLLSCLGDKEPEIVQMERVVNKVRKEKADLLLKRRRQDITDQEKECATIEIIQPVVLPQEVLSRQRRGVEREGRRRRRREERERREKEVKGEHRQGMSTDDEVLEINRHKFENNMSKAVAGKDEIFSDVVDDFCHLSNIKERFEEWKFRFPDSYSKTHIPLYLSQLFSPFIRLQMLQWNPLEDDCLDFESMNWFEVLMFYGFREGAELDPDDPDTHLLPELVDYIIIPKLTTLVQSVWEPLSTRQTKSLMSLIHQLADDYPTVTGTRRNTQTLFTAVLSRLRRTTNEDVFIPLYTKSQVENIQSPQAVFYNQQFWSCVKLLGNITEWEGLVSPDALQELVLDGLLNRYLVLSLQTCPSSSLSVIKTEAIISRLPLSWQSDGATVMRPLQYIISYLIQLAEQLHRSSIGHPDHMRQKIRTLIKDISGQLSRLGAVQENNLLCQEYNIPHHTQ